MSVRINESTTRFRLLTQAQLEEIHENTLKIMANIGIVMDYEPALEVLKKGGCKIDGKQVYFPRKLVEDSIKLCPSEFKMHGRNANKTTTISCDTVNFAGPNCSAFVTDLDKGHRSGTAEDFRNFIKIIDKLENVDIQSQIPVELNDVPVDNRPYQMIYDTVKYNEKPFMGSSLGYTHAKQCIEMASIAFGGLEEIRKNPIIVSIPCTLTPLSYDGKMLGALMAYAELGQPQMINSLSMGGTTTPATIAAQVSVQNAEVLAGIVLAQLVNPGTPVIYAAAGSNTEFSTLMLSIGSPEDAIISIVNGQLCNWYGIPCRTSGALTDSKLNDAQAGYESAITLMAGPISGGNFMLHAVGILDSYNTASYEQLIIDNEIIGYLKHIMEGVPVDEETLAYDVIEEEGPQSNFITNDHTLEFYRETFYMPTLSDRKAYEAWAKNGAESAAQRANKKWKKILEDCGDNTTLPKDVDRDMKNYMEKICGVGSCRE